MFSEAFCFRIIKSRVCLEEVLDNNKSLPSCSFCTLLFFFPETLFCTLTIGRILLLGYLRCEDTVLFDDELWRLPDEDATFDGYELEFVLFDKLLLLLVDCRVESTDEGAGCDCC